MATISITYLAIEMAVLEDTHSWYASTYFFYIVSPCRSFSADLGNISGEWAIARLQAQAAQYLHKPSRAAFDVDMNDLSVAEEPFVGPIWDPHITHEKAPQRNGAQNEATRVGRYHCISENLHGNLCLDTEGVYFEMHLTARQKWRLNYAELKSMQKVSFPGYRYER